jgi:hypothetical protein
MLTFKTSVAGFIIGLLKEYLETGWQIQPAKKKSFPL